MHCRMYCDICDPFNAILALNWIAILMFSTAYPYLQLQTIYVKDRHVYPETYQQSTFIYHYIPISISIYHSSFTIVQTSTYKLCWPELVNLALEIKILTTPNCCTHKNEMYKKGCFLCSMYIVYRLRFFNMRMSWERYPSLASDIVLKKVFTFSAQLHIP